MRKLLVLLVLLLATSCELHEDPLCYSAPAPIDNLVLDYCSEYVCAVAEERWFEDGRWHVMFWDDWVDYCCKYHTGDIYCKEGVQDGYYDGPWVRHRFPCDY